MPYFAAKTDMEQIKSWQGFLECRTNLLGHLADTARKCWHHENIVTNFYENHIFRNWWAEVESFRLEGQKAVLWDSEEDTQGNILASVYGCRQIPALRSGQICTQARL